MQHLKKYYFLLIIVSLLVSCQPIEKRENPQTLEEKTEDITKQIEDMQRSLDEKIDILSNIENYLEEAGEASLTNIITDLKNKKQELAKSARNLQNASDENIDDIQKESVKTLEDVKKIKEELANHNESIQEWFNDQIE